MVAKSFRLLGPRFNPHGPKQNSLESDGCQKPAHKRGSLGNRLSLTVGLNAWRRNSDSRLPTLRILSRQFLTAIRLQNTVEFPELPGQNFAPSGSLVKC